MRIKFSQFDDESYDPSEGHDDASAWEEEQVFRDSIKEREESESSENPLYVTVYSVERLYGGPEEGGWWYDAYHIQPENYDNDGEPIGAVSFPVKNQQEAEIKKQELEKIYPFVQKELSSVRGQGTHVVMIEDYKGEHETTVRPRYE